MTDRKRLTIRKGNKTYINSDTIPRKNCEGKYGFHFCKNATKCRSIVDRKCPVLRILDKLAYYEDLEEQGKLIIQPCKVGDTVYRIYDKRYIGEDKVSYLAITRLGLFYINEVHIATPCDEFGKTVFLTKEDAEAKLKELNGQ